MICHKTNFLDLVHNQQYILGRVEYVVVCEPNKVNSVTIKERNTNPNNINAHHACVGLIRLVVVVI
jgi:hypothetical protein